ncbi:hypothetical protein FRX31_014482 [Thalictrum thalictroides]|uniref:Uncharacterized protein n=1 Tax=Thalictrum thalictroides TaxID=46969 RepID=A0A7J6WEY2_THATH|nr:hypothetical protein FRX31_014482 [Thalictrum thalictroides]
MPSREKYIAAAFWYIKQIDFNNAIVRSNRSLCWACLKDGDKALRDAEACLRLARKWPKAYYRAGATYFVSENVLDRHFLPFKFDRAVDAFSKGLKLAPKDKELQNALQEAIEAKMKSTTA